MDVTDLDLESRLLAGLPIVDVFYDRLGIDRLLETHVPGDGRLRVSPAAALGVVIRNLVMRHAQLKNTQLVAPMWLRDPARIEGLLTCHFIAMLISSRSNAPSAKP